MKAILSNVLDTVGLPLDFLESGNTGYVRIFP